MFSTDPAQYLLEDLSFRRDITDQDTESDSEDQSTVQTHDYRSFRIGKAVNINNDRLERPSVTAMRCPE